MGHPRQVFSRETILNRIWGYEYDGRRQRHRGPRQRPPREARRPGPDADPRGPRRRVHAPWLRRHAGGGVSPAISIRWKLTIAYVALVTAIVAILGFALYRGLESFLLDDVGDADAPTSCSASRPGSLRASRCRAIRRRRPGRSGTHAGATSGGSPGTSSRRSAGATPRSW